MSNVGTKLREWAKALGAFGATVIGICGLIAASPEARELLPANIFAIIAIIGLSGALIGGTVGAIPNRLNAKQISKAPPEELGKVTTAVAGVVAGASANAVTSALETYIRTRAHNVPDPNAAQALQGVADAVNTIGVAVATSVVDSVLDSYRKSV